MVSDQLPWWMEEQEKRFKFLCRHIPACPKCFNDIQIQLVRKDAPAEWKCRFCKHRWVYEPPLDTQPPG